MTNNEIIKFLQSKQIPQCGDKVYTANEEYEAYQRAIEALDQQPCEDAIRRDMVKKWICNTCPDDSECQRDCDAIKGIDALPSVTQKSGRWIFVDKAKEHAHCSECDYGNVDLFDGRPHNYCPNCGAKMQESEVRDDT